MGEPGSVNDDTIKQQAARLGIAHEMIVALGGRRYVGLIRRLWACVEAPLEGKGGMFQQMAWLKKQTDPCQEKGI